jgi:hypothetical protein
MITTLVQDSELRSFRNDLKSQGFFVVRSVMTSRGYLVTYVADPR